MPTSARRNCAIRTLRCRETERQPMAARTGTRPPHPPVPTTSPHCNKMKRTLTLGARQGTENHDFLYPALLLMSGCYYATGGVTRSEKWQAA